MKKILIVDDKDYNLKSIDRLLKKKIDDIQTFLAPNEKEAEKIMESHAIDIVITDLVITTDSGGLEVLKSALNKDPLTMVIVITSFHELLDRTRAFELGAFDCLQKGEIDLQFGSELVTKTKNAILFKDTTMNLIESQKKRIELEKDRDLLSELSRYFDPMVLNIYKTDRNLLRPKKKFVTIAFWDIRGFSLLSEILIEMPELICDFLKEYFEIAATIISKHNGILDKFIGDGIMAIFGSFNEGEDQQLNKKNALDAANAAWELRHEFSDVYEKWKNVWVQHTGKRIDIGLGCGLHSGNAIIGNSGTDIRDHFTAIGSTVNTASRIESTSGKKEIRVSETTKFQINDCYLVEEVIPQPEKLKNIPFEYIIYQINGVIAIGR